MICTTGQRLGDELTEAIHLLGISDADMKNPKITLRIRSERWKIASARVSEARDRILRHRSECPLCNGKG
jgi:hypothetical protein